MSPKNKSLRRSAGNREQRQRFLIYCEGEVTEPIYFKGLKRELRGKGISVELGSSFGEPLSLVRKAVEHQRQAPQRREDGYQAYDYVWCVFDVEAPESHASLDQALRLAQQKEVHCAISNPCFEVWLLLHFRECRAYLTTREASNELQRHHCGYTVAYKSYEYAKLRDLRQPALQRARRLDDRYQEESSIRDRNPWTSVWRLAEELAQRA